jgi:hypothetical protein
LSLIITIETIKSITPVADLILKMADFFKVTTNQLRGFVGAGEAGRVRRLFELKPKKGDFDEITQYNITSLFDKSSCRMLPCLKCLD